MWIKVQLGSSQKRIAHFFPLKEKVKKQNPFILSFSFPYSLVIISVYFFSPLLFLP